MESKLLTNLCFCSLTFLFQEAGHGSLSGASEWPTDTAGDSHLISNSRPRRQLFGFMRAVAAVPLMQNILMQTDRPATFIEQPGVESFHKGLDSSQTISQTVCFNLLLKKNATTLSHLALLEGDVEGVVVVEKRKDAVCVAPSPKLKATYARTDISHSNPCDPNCLYFTLLT